MSGFAVAPGVPLVRKSDGCGIIDVSNGGGSASECSNRIEPPPVGNVLSVGAAGAVLLVDVGAELKVAEEPAVPLLLPLLLLLAAPASSSTIFDKGPMLEESISAATAT